MFNPTKKAIRKPRPGINATPEANATVLPVFQNGEIVRNTGGRLLIEDDSVAEDFSKRNGKDIGWGFTSDSLQ